MHNVAYHKLGLQHSYQVVETTSLHAVEELVRDPDFGGASISLPFKASILPSIDIKSPHAAAIGAINTLLPLSESLETDAISLEYQASQRNRAGAVIGWYGDNTDWLGIFECVYKSLSPRNTIRPSKTTALVIGTGGAARAAIYALIRMGCRKILIFNRTLQHTEQVADHFNNWVGESFTPAVVDVIESISDPWPPGLQPATIIISCIRAHSIDGQSPANFTLPDSWLQSKYGGVVADVSQPSYQIWKFRIKYTNIFLRWSACLSTSGNSFTKANPSLRSRSSVPWITVDGLEMLAIQAIHQFELMTGRKAPRSVIESQVRDGGIALSP